MTKKSKKSLTQMPMTDEQLKQVNAYDIGRIKFTDEERVRLREINAERKKRIEEMGARLTIEEQPILADLCTIGCNIESVWFFYTVRANYPDAIPILLKHLLLPYSDRTREGIARALSFREAKYAWPVIVEEYKKAPIGKGIIEPNGVEEYRLGTKDALAAALSIIADASVIEELIELAKDCSNGESRILLLSAIKKSKSAIAKQAIIELSFDSQLSKEIESWVKKKDKNLS
jgi:hypothetical protein